MLYLRIDPLMYVLLRYHLPGCFGSCRINMRHLTSIAGSLLQEPQDRNGKKSRKLWCYGINGHFAAGGQVSFCVP